MAEPKNMPESQLKPLPTLQERLVEKSIKTIENVVGEQTTNRLAANQSPMEIIQQLIATTSPTNPNDVLNKITELSNTQVPKAGSMTGILPALFQAAGGKGFHPFAPKDTTLGFSDALSLYNAQEAAKKQQLEGPKSAVDLFKSMVETAKLTGDAGMAASLGINKPEGAIETYMGEPTEKGLGQKVRAEVTAKAQAEHEQKTKEFSSEIDNYFAVGDLLPTQEGLDRLGAGLKLFGKSITQSDLVGAAAAELDGLNKRLRVKLVRQAGDVGNLNIVEQKAAEQLLFSLNDSTKLRGLKKAYLEDIKTGIRSGDSSNVKNLIQKWIEEPDFKTKNKALYDRYQKTYKPKTESSTVDISKFGFDPNKFELVEE
jgi:hypothetical protein